MQNNGSFSHGYGAPQQGYQQDYPQDYSQQQQQYQDYNQPQQQYGQQQQQYPVYDQQQQHHQQQQQYQDEGSQYGYGGRPDEYNAPDYGRQSSFHGSESGYDEKQRDFNQDGYDGEDGDRGIKEFFTSTNVDAYNQEHTEIRKGRVVGAALLTGLVAYGAKKYIDNKKEKNRMKMEQEIGGGYPYGAEQKTAAPFGTTQPGNPYGNPY
ncbi:hypothetical protein FB645_003969 [Coemansia sp. IMI 203386]|nr:hypothetical protein FB645_003969 [Coemansia sp. IMI 203386]